MSDDVITLGGPTVPPTAPATPAEPIVPATDQSAELAILNEQLKAANARAEAAGLTAAHYDRDLEALTQEEADLTQALGGPDRVKKMKAARERVETLRELSRTVTLAPGEEMAKVELLEREAMRRGDQAEIERLQRVKLAALMGR